MTLLSEIVARPRPGVAIKAQEEAIRWAKNTRPEWANTCNFAHVKEDGTVKSHLARDCHANIQYPGFDRNGDIACVATDIAIDRRDAWFRKFVGTRNSGIPLEDTCVEKWADVDWTRVEAYLKWFLYESYFSPFIINKDDIEYVKRYGIVVTSDIPACLLQNIMISSRYFIECSPYSFDMFNALTAKGIDPNIAYVTAFHTGGSSYLTRNSDLALTHVTGNSSHRSTGLLSKAGMKNMMIGEFGFQSIGTLAEDKNYRNYHYYSGGVSFFGAGDFIRECLVESAELRETLSAFRKEKASGEAYVAPNPFASPSPKAANGDPLKYTYTEMFECLVPFIYFNNLLEK